MVFFDIQFVGPLLAGFLSLVIGIFTYASSRANATYRYFLAVTVVIAFWSFSIAIFHIPGESVSLWWNVHWIAGLFLAPTVLLSLWNFPAKRLHISSLFRLCVWGGAIGVAFLVVSLPTQFIQYYVVTAGAIPQVTVGPLAWVYELYFGLYFALGFMFVARRFIESYGRARAQIAAGLLGLAVGIGGASFTNLLLPIHFGVELIWLGPIFGIIGTTSFSYMLFGFEGGRTRLFPIFILGLAVVAVLLFQMVIAQNVEALILNGAIVSGISVLVIFLVRDTLAEIADLRRFQDLSRRLQRANEDLKKADRVKSEFLAIVSHHLRTPLTHIKWALTEMAEGSYGKKLDPEQEKLTKALLANNERLVHFIESFMDTSRIETGKIVLQKESVDIIAILKALVNAIEDRAKNYYRVEIEFLPPTEKIPRIGGDEDSLRKVFENILENAVTYNKPGGKVYIKTEKEENSLMVEITDTGIGMTPENLQRAGEKFFRSPAAKSHVAEGTGLGVFIAKHIVKLHGGKFHIESQAGQGTTVQIILPIS